MGEAVYPTHHVVVGIGDQAVIVVTGNSRRKERHDRRGSPNCGQATTGRMAESPAGARNCVGRGGALKSRSTGLLFQRGRDSGVFVWGDVKL